MKRCLVGMPVLTVCLAGTTAQAQLVPWRTFSDPDSTSVCDLVNTDDAELVVLLNSDRLVLVTGTDSELVNTEVTSSGNVLIDGDPFGFIDFATDAEGFRTLWWMSFTGRVIHLDGITLVPSESDVFPLDVATVPCDACPFWDDGAICTCIRDSECDDFDECTQDECDPLGGCDHVPVICAGEDACRTGTCDPIMGCVFADVVCEDDDDPCADAFCDPVEGCLIVETICESDGDPCTDEVCSGGDCVIIENSDACSDGDRCTSNDRCRDGVCRGTPVSNCDDDGGGGGGPVIVLCGESMAMAFMLTFTGLLATGAARRRRSV